MVKAKVVAKIPKGPGSHVEIHVRTMSIDGIDLVDIRDYYPALKTYGRGMHIPKLVLDDLLAGLKKVGE